jgi:hypothetical protein
VVIGPGQHSSRQAAPARLDLAGIFEPGLARGTRLPLNATGLPVILHVGIGRRWPFRSVSVRREEI